MCLCHTVFFTLGRECLNATELEIQTNIFILKHLQHWKRIPHLNPCCLKQESSEKPVCSCQLKFVIFFYNPNKIPPIDLLWCFTLCGSLRKRKLNTSHSLGATFITTILHVLNLSEFLTSILKWRRQNDDTGQNPKMTI